MDYDCIGIDVGGTHIKGVLIDGETITHQLKHETKDGGADWKQTVSRIFETLQAKSKATTINVGLSAPGIANSDNRSISYMPERLIGIENFNWSEHLGIEVHVLNDAHAALWAEAQWGVGKGVANIVLLTLGTGVGGGLLIGGKLHQGFLQRAGHLGHISLDSGDESPSIAGIPGSLEEAIGECTLAFRSRGRFIKTIDLILAFEKGDTWATYVWLSSVRKLSLAISSFCNAFSPELVILAGGITKAGECLMQPLASFLDLYEWRPGGHQTQIKLAMYEDFAGAIGAGLFARIKGK